jgi:4'-phosphopantetheinyl transferase
MSDVDLFYLAPAALPNQGRDWLPLLDAVEAGRNARLVQPEDRLAHVAAHGLLRLALSRRDPSVAPRDWRFTTGRRGKPGLPTGGLAFNLSHCRELVAVAVTSGPAVGVDVEPVNARHATPEVARRVYSAGELADQAAQPDPVARFFERWTVKEAWVKATGAGLSDDLACFEVRLEAGRAFVVRGDPRPWQLHWWTPVAGVKLGLCVESSQPLSVAPRPWPG